MEECEGKNQRPAMAAMVGRERAPHRTREAEVGSEMTCVVGSRGGGALLEKKIVKKKIMKLFFYKK